MWNIHRRRAYCRETTKREVPALLNSVPRFYGTPEDLFDTAIREDKTRRLYE